MNQKKWKRVLRCFVLGLSAFSISATAFAGEMQKEERVPLYDRGKLEEVLGRIEGMEVKEKTGSEEEGIEPYASAGETVTSTVLKKGIGSIDMIRYTDGGWENLKSWQEGLLGLTNGEWAYCADPNQTYKSGQKQCYNAADFYSEETIKTIGMMFYFFDTQVKCEGMTKESEYLIKQCIVWSVLDHVNGWLPGITLEYGNGLNDGAGHGLAGHMAHAVYDGAVWAADAKNREDFSCKGILMKGSGQDLAQWSYEYRPKGAVSLKKVSANSEVTDKNQSYSLAGAEYGVYLDENCKQQAGTLTTDQNGISGKLSLQAGTYYIKELKPPKGYARDTVVHKVVLESGKDTILTVSDHPQINPVEIVLEKADQDTSAKQPIGAAEFKGAEFEVRYYGGFYEEDPANDGQKPLRVWKLKTDEKGVARLTEQQKVSGDDFYQTSDGEIGLPLGTITIQETKAPKGYLRSEETVVRRIRSSGEEERVETYNIPVVKEAVIRGDLQIVKYAKKMEYTEDTPATGERDVKKKEAKDEEGKVNGSNEGEAQKDADKEAGIKGRDTEDKAAEDGGDRIPLEGIVFRITSVVTGESWDITTDQDGIATTKDLKLCDRGNLVYGSYLISELNPPEGYHKIEPFEVTISENRETLSYQVENEHILTKVKLVKKDAVSGKIIPAAKAVFQLLDQEKQVIPLKETIETDENGSFTLSQRLKNGIYYFREITAPYGYLKGEDVKFEIAAKESEEDKEKDEPEENKTGGDEAEDKTKAEDKSKDEIKGKAREEDKAKDEIKDKTKAEDEIKEKNEDTETVVVEFKDEPVMGRIEILKKDASTGKGLSDTTLEILAAENILSGDGTLVAKNGEVVETLTTGKDGVAKSGELYLGKYKIKETKAKEGYILKQEDYLVELKYKDQETPLVTEKVTIENEPMADEAVLSVKTGDLLEIFPYAAACLLAGGLILRQWKVRGQKRK